jgi:hypothetical protein
MQRPYDPQVLRELLKRQELAQAEAMNTGIRQPQIPFQRRVGASPSIGQAEAQGAELFAVARALAHVFDR